MEKKQLRYQPEVLRDEMFNRDRVIAALQEGPKTIPELAAALEYPSHEVMMWVMALRRYGIVTEMPKARADDYFQYRLVEGD